MYKLKISIFAIVLLISSIATINNSLFAQDLSKQNKQKQKIEKEISYIDRQIKATKSSQKASVNKLTLLKKKISVRNTLLKEIDREVRTIAGQIIAKNRELNQLHRDLDTLEKYYKVLVYNAYRNRNEEIWFLYIFASKDLGEGYRRWSYFKNFSNTIKRQTQQIQEAQATLIREREKLTQLKSSSQNKQKEREKEYQIMVGEQSYVTKQISKLSNKEKDFKKQLSIKRREVEKLNREMQRILAEAIKEQQRRDKLAANKEIKAIDIKLSGSFASNKGKFPLPVSRGVIVESFGQHNHPVFPNIKLPFNNGVNISTDKNATVFSIFDGVVKQIIVMPGYNQCVLVQHGSYFTFYCKLNRVVVKSGQTIKAGETIGVLDEVEGNSILHFQLWNGTTKQNPESWLKR